MMAGKRRKQKRTPIDYEAMGRVYRTGKFSDREIAAQFHCSHTTVQNNAKKRDWKKDLAGQIKTEVANKLVAKVANGNTDDAIVDAAAEIGAQIIVSHRKDIRNLRALESQIINEVFNNPTKLYITQYQGEIVEKEVGLTAAERAQAANNLANVQHKRIALERQAFNLDDQRTSSSDPVETLLDEVARRAAPLVPNE